MILIYLVTTIHLHKKDYDLIYKYYNSFINSVEVRLMTNLFYSVPKNTRSKVNLYNLFKNNSLFKSNSTTVRRVTLLQN